MLGIIFHVFSPKEKTLKIQNIKTAELIPYASNAKKHNRRQIENVAESIKQYGFVQPLVVDRSNVVVIGHCRLLAAKKLGIAEVPCVKVEDLTDEQVKALRIVDNKTNESEWLDDILKLEIEDIDFSGFDFDFGEDAKEPVIVEVDVPELPEEKEPTTKLGDIWQLGRHRLMCGDSTKPKDVQQLMNGEEADLVITDPPYNVDYTGGTKEKLKIMNDNMDSNSFRGFLREAFATTDAVMRVGAAFYIWHADGKGYNFRGACADVGWEIRECLIWVKNCFVLGRQDYQWQHEPCLYGWKDGAAHYFIDDRTQSTVIEDEAVDIKKLKKDELLHMLENIMAEKRSTTIIREDKPAKNDLHPTMKPIKVIARFVRNSSKLGWLTYDPFGGSGSTLMTCEQLNRRCNTMELDPKYCDVIIQRWENFTGEHAQKIN